MLYNYRLLFSKKKELGDAANKLKNGLSKIDDTREKVEKMSVELEDAKTKVAQFQRQCEEYLVIIVSQKREADEQQKVCTSLCVTTYICPRNAPSVFGKVRIQSSFGFIPCNVNI